MSQENCVPEMTIPSCALINIEFIQSYKSQTQVLSLKLNIWILFKQLVISVLGFPCGSVVKTLSATVGDMGLIPGSGRSPGEGNGNPLQYSCLGNPMDRGAWWATDHGVAKSWTLLSN